MIDQLRRPATYSDLVRSALERYPSQTAFVHGRRTWTCGETSDTISRVQRVLSRLGLERGDGIAVLSGNRPEGWMVEQAAIALGARLVPLRPLGGLDDQAFMCDDAEVKLLAFEAGPFDGRAVELQERLPALQVFGIGPSEVAPDLLAAAMDEPSGRIQTLARHRDVAGVIYTGGTTGRPKGVMLPHRSLVANFWLEISGHQWPDRPRFLAVTPISHAAFLLTAPCLALGGSVVLHERFDPEHVIADAAALRVSATFIVPSMLSALLEHPDFDPHKLRSLQTVLYGASAVDPGRLAQALEALGQIFVQTYAQTEAPNTATALRKEDHDLRRPQLLASCGKPLVGVEVEVHDAEENECPRGEVGEIVIRGPTVMDGYWRRPDETAETLRNGWLHTGDLARRDDEGYLYIVDRLKDLITTGGLHVYPREVEDVLSAHPAVAAVAVIGISDEALGESLKAIVVKKPGAEVSADELIGLVREKKGSAQAPASVEFVDAIPLTGLGKPDKKLLRSRYGEAQLRPLR